MLLSCLLKQYNAKLNKKLKGFTADAENALLSCRWKGNVRELANVIEYAINVEPSAYITTNSLPFKILEKREVKVQTTPVSTLHLAESELIRSVLSEFGSSVAAKRRAAEALGISLSTLYRKLKEMGIDQG
jgi:transcriptional regulator with PAS, ATPase and Fis domain